MRYPNDSNVGDLIRAHCLLRNSFVGTADKACRPTIERLAPRASSTSSWQLLWSLSDSVGRRNFLVALGMGAGKSALPLGVAWFSTCSV